jgi:hypothetical protein
MLNQGTIRQRGVSVGGVFFGYFLDKQKVTRKEMVRAPFHRKFEAKEKNIMTTHSPLN